MPPKTDPKPNNKDAGKKDEKAGKGGKEDDSKKKEGEGSCSSFAKALIYIIPIALYIPWAYRMFKGNACCPEMPKPVSAASCSSSYGRHPPRWGGGGRGKGKGDGCCEGEAAENPCAMPKEEPCYEDKCPKEKDDCENKSRQCLNKCLDKCLAKEGGRGKKKKQKRRKDECDEDEDA